MLPFQTMLTSLCPDKEGRSGVGRWEMGAMYVVHVDGTVRVTMHRIIIDDCVMSVWLWGGGAIEITFEWLRRETRNGSCFVGTTIWWSSQFTGPTSVLL